MTLLRRCATLLGIAGLAAGSVVAACQHEVPGPVVDPAHREVQPMAPQPVPAEPTKTIPARPGVLIDGGIPIGAPSEPQTSVRPIHHVTVAQRDDVEPMSVPVKQDAGVDGGVNLPPVPDAGPTVVKDAGQPM